MRLSVRLELVCATVTEYCIDITSGTKCTMLVNIMLVLLLAVLALQCNHYQIYRHTAADAAWYSA
jgi:hypothetical protein